MMRFGFVCSAGGATIENAHQLLSRCGYERNFFVVTDRECGAETACMRLGLPFTRIEDTSRDEFSRRAAHWLYDKHEVDITILFFSRLITEVLYSRAPCVNIHPSLLPNFPGLSALKRTLDSGAKFFGATAHLVDHSIDGGEILAQAVAPILQSYTLKDLKRISFAQKLYLLLVIYEWATRQTARTKKHFFQEGGFSSSKRYSNPALRSIELEEAFIQFMNQERVSWP